MKPICQACGTQFPETSEPPRSCPICSDARQSIPVQPFNYDRISGAWWDRQIDSNAQAAVAKSAARYVSAIGSDT
jgi:hypothetical protein